MGWQILPPHVNMCMHEFIWSYMGGGVGVAQSREIQIGGGVTKSVIWVKPHICYNPIPPMVNNILPLKTRHTSDHYSTWHSKWNFSFKWIPKPNRPKWMGMITKCLCEWVDQCSVLGMTQVVVAEAKGKHGKYKPLYGMISQSTGKLQEIMPKCITNKSIWGQCVRSWLWLL